MAGSKTGSWEMWVAPSILNKILRSSIWHPDDLIGVTRKGNHHKGTKNTKKKSKEPVFRLCVLCAFVVNSEREGKSYVHNRYGTDRNQAAVFPLLAAPADLGNCSGDGAGHMVGAGGRF